jgi:hypothetical protein
MLNYDYIITHIIPSLLVLISIGLSDMIEFYINPIVHYNHNCPDIMRMRWENYNSLYAFVSGIKCSWFLILPICLFTHNIYIMIALAIINILIPVWSYVTGNDKHDMYYAHKLLYIVNPIFIICSIISSQ